MKFTVPRNGVPDTGSASWVRAEGDPLPHPVFVRLALGDDGQLIATGLLVDAESGELTTRGSRVSLADVVRAFASAVSRPATYKRLARELHGRAPSAAEGDWRPDLSSTPWIEFVAVSASGPDALRHVPVPRTRPGRRGHPDEHYLKVAQAYRRAKRTHPRAPIRALMEELHAAEPTVHRWVRTARERGYLDKRPRAGETAGGMDTEE
jgi:hypothetical protein